MARGHRRRKDRPRTRGQAGGAVHLGDGEPVCGATLAPTADLTVRVVADLEQVTCRACIAIHQDGEEPGHNGDLTDGQLPESA